MPTKTKSILITGGAGFIGSNFIRYFMNKYQDFYQIINLDKLTYASDHENLKDLKSQKNYFFIKDDICNQKIVLDLFENFKIGGVIHFAAESHVDNSIKNPAEFIETNIKGTFTLLEVARNFWLKSPNNPKKEFEEARFHHVSTDEVYGSLPKTGLFTEETAYAPNSPYSASKASSDFLVRAYFRTYSLNTTISNCSNNYGPFQHEEKLIPVIIKKAFQLEEIPIYGDGKNIRDWLYVEDHCRAIDLIYHQAKNGESYNIGGSNEKTNLEIVKKICQILDQKKPRKDQRSYQELIKFVPDRYGHDRRYAIDNSKIKNKLNWQAKESFETGISKTVDWYLSNLAAIPKAGSV